MIRFVRSRDSIRLLGALALVGLGLGCVRARGGTRTGAGAAQGADAGTSPLAVTGGLLPPSERITDEAINADLARLAAWQRRLTLVTATPGRDPARRYVAAKAEAWLAFAREEYWANDRGPVVEESLEQAVRLLGVLLDGQPEAVEAMTSLPSGTRRVRADLWREVERFKAHPRFDLVADDVALLEVELVRAGHDAAAGAACSAEPHERAAGRLGAFIDSVLKSAPPPEPPTPVVPLVPLPGPEPVLDRDGDGVVDAFDCCPNTPRGKAVDARGCPEPTTETQRVLDGVEFATDRSAIRRRAREVLDSVVAELVLRPAIPVEVSGHTDWVAEDDYNLRLSSNRARRVRDYLVANGVAADRITAVGYGETRPRDSNETREGRQRNRRVELEWQLPVQLDLLASCADAPDARPVPRTEPDVTAAVPTIGPRGVSTLSRVQFETASITIHDAARTILQRAAATLRARPDMGIEVAGHADEAGDAESNFALSLARAYKVRALLIELGVPSSQLAVRGYGSERPFRAGRGESARAQNRRVELVVVGVPD